MKQLKNFAALIFALTLIIACNKDEDQASGVGDALIVTKKSGANTVYGISFYAYTFSSFKSVQVDNGDNTMKKYNLKANQGTKTNFYYETPNAEFTTTKPFASTYHFVATFENGATDIFEDILSDKTLALPVFEKCEYNATRNQLEVSWPAVTDANSYAINILDGSNLVFVSTELANTVKTYSISTNGGGWATGFTPVSGKTYTVRLFAFLYEPQGNSYNVQASSVSETTAIWGD